MIFKVFSIILILLFSIKTQAMSCFRFYQKTKGKNQVQLDDFARANRGRIFKWTVKIKRVKPSSFMFSCEGRPNAVLKFQKRLVLKGQIFKFKRGQTIDVTFLIHRIEKTEPITIIRELF